jgi:hypothetical protein
MHNHPQLPIEEITLIPHPMDAWRAALNALIACAPGDGPAIAAHLAEARLHALTFIDRTCATPGTTKLVDRLMLIGAGKLVGQRLDALGRSGQVDSLGFTTNAPVIGLSYSRPANADDQQAAGQPTHSASASQPAAAAALDLALAHEPAAAPAVAVHPEHPAVAAMPQAPGTLAPSPQSAQPAHQNPDRS